MMRCAAFVITLLLCLAAPAQTSRPATAPAALLIPDVPYGADPAQKLDIRQPPAPPGSGPFPIVILIHGGGWSGGDKAKDITPIFDPLADAGFLTLSINYRLAPANRWPACLEDLHRRRPAPEGEPGEGFR